MSDASITVARRNRRHRRPSRQDRQRYDFISVHGYKRIATIGDATTDACPSLTWGAKSRSERVPLQIYKIIFVVEFVVFAEGFLGGLDEGVNAVPFVFGVVEVELFGAERAFEGDLVGREGLGVGAS
jgi:hypothetical protein